MGDILCICKYKRWYNISWGVKEKNGEFSVSGVKSVDKVVKELWDNLNNSKKVSANIISDRDVIIEDIDGKSIIKIVVPRADRRDKPVFIGEIHTMIANTLVHLDEIIAETINVVDKRLLG